MFAITRFGFSEGLMNLCIDRLVTRGALVSCHIRLASLTLPELPLHLNEAP
jgi:hypothetical protein